ALSIEADRMRNIRIDPKHEFEQEKGAVIAELKGNEDQPRSEEHTSELQSHLNLVCRLLLEKKKRTGVIDHRPIADGSNWTKVIRLLVLVARSNIATPAALTSNNVNSPTRLTSSSHDEAPTR